MFDMRFKNPCAFILAGGSQSGKTTLTLNILRNANYLFETPECTQNILFFYNEWQSAYESISTEENFKKKLHFINKLPTVDFVKEKTLAFKGRGGSIVVIDDFQNRLNNDIATIFQNVCHHYDVTVFLLVQNIFPPVKAFRDISLNAQYIVLFKNARDGSQIVNFLKQFAPGNSKGLGDLFREVTESTYSYMLFDVHPTTPKKLRIRSHILPSEGTTRVYVPEED
jgi:hypothetical protein